jgi:hypothetical protein
MITKIVSGASREIPSPVIREITARATKPNKKLTAFDSDPANART